jgi:excisionase family DNA binding protein
MTETDLLSTAQVAEILGKSVPTVNRWVREGALKPTTKLPGISGAYVFTREAVEDFRDELAAKESA